MPILPVPAPILARFEALLEKRTVAPNQRADYKKWLRYFLDFQKKYPVPAARSEQVRLFIETVKTGSGLEKLLFQQFNFNHLADGCIMYIKMLRDFL